MANTALGNRFYGLVLVKPDLKEVQKANYQSLACHTGPENDLAASLWPGGGVPVGSGPCFSAVTTSLWLLSPCVGTQLTP